jgi:hypothetical protein
VCPTCSAILKFSSTSQNSITPFISASPARMMYCPLGFQYKWLHRRSLSVYKNKKYKFQKTKNTKIKKLKFKNKKYKFQKNKKYKFQKTKNTNFKKTKNTNFKTQKIQISKHKKYKFQNTKNTNFKKQITFECVKQRDFMHFLFDRFFLTPLFHLRLERGVGKRGGEMVRAPSREEGPEGHGVQGSQGCC